MDETPPIKLGETPQRRGREADRSIKLLHLKERGSCVKRALGRQAIDTSLATETAR